MLCCSGSGLRSQIFRFVKGRCSWICGIRAFKTSQLASEWKALMKKVFTGAPQAFQRQKFFHAP
jgi:hypothetical protein